MKITILPCVGTNQAIAEIEDGKLPVKIHSPRKLDAGETELLLWRLYRDVCNYRWELDHYKHLAYVAIPWAIASAIACYYRSSDLWNVGVHYFALFGWVGFWLMADGLWCLIQVLNKLPQWIRARRAFEALKDGWATEVVLEKRLAEIAYNRDDWHYRRTATSATPRGFTENAWIEGMQHDEQYGHLYKRFLKRYPPRAMDLWPVGIWRFLSRMIGGVPVRAPWMCWPVEK